jgi:HD-like signal output (HDOD) protein
LRGAESLRDLRPQMAALWREGVTVAAFAHVIARRHTHMNADIPLLAGLLHGVGKLYILTRLNDHPGLRAYPESCERILREWHAGVARAVLDNCAIPEEVGEAVLEFEDLERDLRGSVALSETLTAAQLFARFREGFSGASVTENDIQPLFDVNQRFWLRLAIKAPEGLVILREAGVEIAALRAVLDA